MTEFEEASAKYQKAKDAYWKAESALATASAELRIADRERSEAFTKEIRAAQDRAQSSPPADVGGSGKP